jgi:(S)-2-hydroxyglutarate dehydrogenase
MQAIARVETGSLTPALSRRERESRIHPSATRQTPSARAVSTRSSERPWLNPPKPAAHVLLLPPGEGRDEGRPLHSSRLGSCLSPGQIREIEPHCTGIQGLWVPQTGIVDYTAVAEKYADKIRALGGEIIFGQRIEAIRRKDTTIEVASANRTWTTRVLVTCAGLHSDRVARLTHPDLPLRITPFRGEYYVLKTSAHHLVRNLIYPVPDPAFPFLGVHFTRMIRGGIECGPNAVFAFGREAYRKTDFHLRDTLETLAWPGFRIVARKYWRTGLGEFRRSWSKAAFVRALQRLIPEITAADLEPGGAGIRAQACDREGRLLDDFDIRIDGNVIHVCNAPSPAATASLAIGATVAQEALSHLGGN